MAETPEAQARELVEVRDYSWPCCGEAGVYCDDHYKSYSVWIGNAHAVWMPLRHAEAHEAASDFRREIAAALRAAEARGRRAGIEAAAKVADRWRDASDPEFASWHDCNDVGKAIRALAATDPARAGEEGNRG